MKQQRMIELLAPAASYEVGVKAIEAGADAIYIGAGRFSARSAAGNPMEDISKLCEFARPFGVKIYLALNTLLHDDELDDARLLALDAIKAGISGIIFQDVRLLDMNLPIEMHASTQTAQLSPQRAQEFERVGATRIVLERGLSLSEIREIADATSCELEVFVHGAICVGYSGICYLSEHLTGRSGNRGQCAQPCRARYNLIDGNGSVLVENEALLSPKDMNLSSRLGELIDAGVTSLKIEGRLKDADYVGNVVAHYNKILQGMGVTRSSWGRSEAQFTPDVRLSFNRGFTQWFFDGVTSEKRLAQSEDGAGEYIGEIRDVMRDYVDVKLKNGIEINNGDGLSFRDNKLEMRGVRVNRAMGSRLFMLSTEGLKIGQKLYRNSKMGWTPKSVRTIDCEVSFTQSGDNYILRAQDEVGHIAEISIAVDSYEVAKDVQRAEANLSGALAKSGGTIFKVNDVKVSCERMPFMPSSVVNSLRREVLDKLEGECRRDAESKIVRDVKTKSMDVKNPRPESLMTTRYCILREKGMCLKTTKLAQPLHLLNNRQKIFLKFDCARCEMHLMADI